MDYKKVLEECLKGKVPPELKELYKAPIRETIPWDLFPNWARPDAIFELGHEG